MYHSLVHDCACFWHTEIPNDSQYIHLIKTQWQHILSFIWWHSSWKEIHNKSIWSLNLRTSFFYKLRCMVFWFKLSSSVWDFSILNSSHFLKNVLKCWIFRMFTHQFINRFMSCYERVVALAPFPAFVWGLSRPWIVLGECVNPAAFQDPDHTLWIAGIEAPTLNPPPPAKWVV